MLWRLFHRMGKKTQQNKKIAQFEEHFSSETFTGARYFFIYLSVHDVNNINIYETTYFKITSLRKLRT